ncbi:MAG: hypothetical protein ACKVX7_03995 [Planctomycetota bacterium]
MARLERKTLLILLMFSTALGCAPTGRYLRSRGADLADCVLARAAFGVGLYAEIEVTTLVRPAVGFGDATLAPRLALEHVPAARQSDGELRTAAFPALFLLWPWYGYAETAEGYGDSHPYVRGFFAPWFLMGNYHVAEHTNGVLLLDRLLVNPRLNNHDEETNAEPVADTDTASVATTAPRARPIADHGWFAASVTPLLGRFDIGLNPLELVDFLTGLVGLDLLRDDGR